MLSFLTTFLGLIPGINSVVSAVLNAYFNSKVQIYMAKTGLEEAVAVEAIKAEVVNNQTKVSWIQALASNPVMLFIVVGFAMPFIIYEWKAVAYDMVWMHGTTSTDPIRGPLADWATIILSGIFVTSTGIGVAHTIINKA
jgi:hypothetical protein